MHTDFREERKWRMALALELAEACVEWHQTPPSERKKLCAKFRAPGEEENAEPIEKGIPHDEETDEMDAKADESGDVTIEDADDREGSNLEENRMEVDLPVSVVPQTPALPPMPEPQFTFNSDEVEQSVPATVLENSISEQEEAPTGQLRGGTDAVLSQAQFPATETNYKPVRHPIVKLNSSALWVNAGELQPLVLKQPPVAANADKPDMAVLKPTPQLPHKTDLPALFPDLQPYTGLGPGPDPTGKKPDRRCDELGSSASKWVPISQFTIMRPIVLSALEPLTHYKDGKWVSFENGAATVEESKQADASKKQEERGVPLSGKIEALITYSTVTEYFLELFVPEGKLNRDKRAPPILKKVPHRPLHWTAEDDTILKSLVEENFSNWRLIAEAFNTLRRTVDIEQRTAEICRERYEMLVPPKETKAEDEGSEIDMDTKDGGLGRIHPDVFQSLNVADSVGDAPKIIRHQLVHRTIKRVTLRRSEMLKEKCKFRSGIFSSA
jgi:chromatin modification-related protein VID21